MLSEKLKRPISWTYPDQDIERFLNNLQGNILKYHGRNNVVFLFCRFRDEAKVAALDFVKRQAQRVCSAKHQLDLTDQKHKTGQKSTAPFVSVFLTKPGYDYFGIAPDLQPADQSFHRGMAAAGLNDPSKADWDSRLRDPHVLILSAVASPEAAQHEATTLLNQISRICDVEGGHAGEIIGNQFFNEAGQGVENFGYVDGRSQPLVLIEDFPAEEASGGMDKWPLRPFPVDQFVVRDPAVADPSAYGSYFVFRQLEQDVRGFKTREDEIVDGQTNFANRDSAGVGRLESGSPFEMRKEDPKDGEGHEIPDITNNFTFVSNPPRCPAFAHIRKVNPRTAATQGNLMIRRGMTYGTRADASPKADDPSMLVLDDTVPTETLPTGGVGLLFQSYQASIRAGFETSQGWANSTDGGIDPVIGQAPSADLDWPMEYGAVAPDTEKLDFYERKNSGGSGPYVKLLGGGYFFAPSMAFLHSL